MATVTVTVGKELRDKKELAEFEEDLAIFALNYRIISHDGPSGGWPEVEISGELSSLHGYLFNYAGYYEDEVEING